VKRRTPGPLQPGGSSVGQAGRVVDIDALGLDFCLTFVRGRTPDEVIPMLGGADPVSIVSADVAFRAADAVDAWVDEDGASHPTRLAYAAVTGIGGWAMIVEPNGVLGTGPAVAQVLSAAGETVSFSFNENTSSRFSWVIDGREVVGFDPAFPHRRHGADPGRLDETLIELGFVVEHGDSEEFDHWYRERTAALMERITGVRWDAGLLDRATFRCAAVGPGASARPWYGEVQEELAAFAEDPRDWHDDTHRERWIERGVTDRRIRALGHAGMRLHEQDGALAATIAYAPADLVERMTRWAWERPFQLAGIAGEPWLAPIRDAVRRGERPAPEDLRLVEDRMDPFLRTALPGRIRDDENRRRNAVRVLLLQWDPQGPAAGLCSTLSMAEGAGAGSLPELLACLRRDFPELDDVVVAPPAPPPAERAAMRRRREAGERRAVESRRRDLERTWGGRIPADERLLDPEVAAHTTGLARHDRDLIDQIAAARPEVQRRMAVWVARYCCTRSGMIANDWVRAGLLALERGEPPPPWFADFDAAFARWRDVPRESIVHHATVSVGTRQPIRIDPAVIAMHTILMARHDNPLIAAMDTVRNAVELYGGRTVVDAFRTAFGLSGPNP
jgi:hypothetical protein